LLRAVPHGQLRFQGEALGEVALRDFAREFLDIEQGFLETVWALTVAPGPALQAYLSGDRNRLMSPGRYLLATLIIQYVVIRGLIWTSALVAVRLSAIVEPSGLLSDAAPSTLTQTVATLLQFVESQKGQIVTYLAVLGLFALLLRLLFHEQLRRRPDAVVLSSFLVGHAVLLETTVHLAWVPPTRLLSGTPVSPVSRTLFSVLFGVAFAVFLGYVGWRKAYWARPGRWLRRKPSSVSLGLDSSVGWPGGPQMRILSTALRSRVWAVSARSPSSARRYRGVRPAAVVSAARDTHSTVSVQPSGPPAYGLRFCRMVDTFKTSYSAQR